jgi:hypothetical protein
LEGEVVVKGKLADEMAPVKKERWPVASKAEPIKKVESLLKSKNPEKVEYDPLDFGRWDKYEMTIDKKQAIDALDYVKGLAKDWDDMIEKLSLLRWDVRDQVIKYISEWDKRWWHTTIREYFKK